MLLVLVLSPFLYFIESQLLSPNPFVNGTNYTSIVYFAVECLIDSVAAMFIYNNVELKIQHVNSELIHGRNFKRILLASLSIVYLFVWFTSGIIFQAMAKQSNGKDFIFQEDLSVSLQAKALKDVADIKADDYTVSSLIKQNELEKDVITFNKSGDNITNFVGSSKNNSSDINTYAKFDFSEPNGTLCVNTIGKYWAEFYSSDFYRKGITQYTYELGSGISVPEALGFKNNTLYPVTISLYKVNSDNTNFNFKEANNISLLGSNEDKNNYELVNKYTILIEDQGFIAELKSAAENKDNGRNPKISILSNMLQHSVLFIDNEYQKTNDMFNMVETQGIRYPLLDFLYYSAVTITTTGYGDILPNSRLIRTLVMFESFFGVGIPGLFISLLFFKVDHKEKKPVV
jgi:Ion channel.